MKISDAMDDINDMDIETDTVLPTINVSTKNIKKMVFTGIGIKKKWFFRKAIIIPLAAVFMIIAATGVAATYFDDFKLFLKGDTEFLESRVQEINQSVTDNGVTMTVESAINDGNSALILLRFTKDDGSEFERRLNFVNLHLGFDDGSGNGSGGYSCHSILSEDKKILYCYIDFNTTTNINENKIALTIDGLSYDFLEVTEYSDLNLDLLYQKEPLSMTDGYDIQNFGEKLFKDQTVFANLEGIVYNSGTLQLYYDVSVNDYMKEFIQCLYNEETKEKIQPVNTTHYFSPAGKEIVRMCVEFADIDYEMLSKLKIVPRYNLRDMIGGIWSIDLELKYGTDSIDKITELNFQEGENTIVINHINISMLAVTIEGTNSCTDYNGYFSPEILLYMDDGEIKTINEASHCVNSGSNTDLKFISNYRVFEPLDLTKIKAISINGNRIEIKE